MCSIACSKRLVRFGARRSGPPVDDILAWNEWMPNYQIQSTDQLKIHKNSKRTSKSTKRFFHMK